MPFDPDAFLAKATAGSKFDPDAFLTKVQAAGNIGTGPGQFASVEDIPGMGGAAPKPQQPRSMLDRLRGVAETGIALAGGAATAPLVSAAEIYGTLTSGKFGTQEGVKSGEAFANRLAQNIQRQIGPKTEAGQEYTSAVSNALAATGLQGLPMPLMQDLQTLAPAATRQVVGQVATSKPVLAVGEKLAERSVAKAEKLSQRSWEQAAQIEAAEAAKKLGVALNPAKSAPSVKTKMLVGSIGESSVEDALSMANRQRWNKVAREDLGLPAGTPIDDAAFNAYREKHSGSYREISNLGTFAPDENVRQGLGSLRAKPTATSDPAKIEAVNTVVDRVIQQMDEGLTGSDVIGQVRGFRNDANRTFRRPDATPVQLEVAKVQLGIANELENLIGANLTDNPRLLGQFRKDRTALAKSYDWERATDPITKQVDPLQLAKDARNGIPLSGKLADVAKVAGTFPDIASTAPSTTPPVYQMLRRGGVGGTIGLGIGGVPGAAIGAGVTSAGGRLAERWLTTPQAQNMLAMPKDYRLPLPQEMVPPIPQNRAVVPYVAPQQILMPGEGPQNPNWIYGRPDATITPAVPPTARALPQPSAESTIGALRTEDARRAAMSRALGQEAEARAAAAESAGRRPTSGEVILDLDPITGRLREVSQGLKGATPETFQDFGKSLKSAADKVTAGKLFDLTADEKIAWNKTKVDLAEAAPEFKALSDKAVAEKMMDRQWIQETIVKARQKADAYEEIANRHYARVEGELARVAAEQARKTALENRDRMMMLAEQLQEALSRPKIIRSDVQGPKTRAANRARWNQLAPESENQNALTR